MPKLRERGPARPLLLLLPVLTLLLGGCRIGPPSLRAGRTAYNEAIQISGNEQILLNIVRLRYRDTPLFLEVSGVASTIRVQTAGGIGSTLRSGATTPLSLDARIVASEEPTVSYTPLQGEAFVEHLLSPIDSTTFVLLMNSGWSIERVLRLCMQSVNGLPNAPRASGPTPDEAPPPSEFPAVARLLRQLQKEGVLELGRSGDDLFLRVDGTAREGADWTALAELLGLDPSPEIHRVTFGAGRSRPGEISLVPRSLMACLFYASQSVRVPAHDEQRGVVTVTRGADGEPYDWAVLLDGLLRVSSAEERPKDAYLAVQHRGAWFYIDDTDLDSKTTFSMLAQLLALQSGEVRGNPFLLTLPVGG